MFRSACEKLLDWKRRSDKCALLVDGARQVGKTFLIEEFAGREYESHVKVDCTARLGIATRLVLLSFVYAGCTS